MMTLSPLPGTADGLQSVDRLQAVPKCVAPPVQMRSTASARSATNTPSIAAARISEALTRAAKRRPTREDWLNTFPSNFLQDMAQPSTSDSRESAAHTRKDGEVPGRPGS